jgi:hypothetical protein
MHFLSHLLNWMCPFVVLFENNANSPPLTNNLLLTDNSNFLLTNNTELLLAGG